MKPKCYDFKWWIYTMWNNNDGIMKKYDLGQESKIICFPQAVKHSHRFFW
jgi:hypothetical protein